MLSVALAPSQPETPTDTRAPGDRFQRQVRAELALRPDGQSVFAAALMDSIGAGASPGA